eukprot:jgi/Mesen1/9340/ME000061S08779
MAGCSTLVSRPLARILIGKASVPGAAYISSSIAYPFRQTHKGLSSLAEEKFGQPPRLQRSVGLLSRYKRHSTISSKMADVEAMDPLQKRLMFDDECILVNEKDEVTGHDSKYNCHLWEKIEKGGMLHRAFSVFLFNSSNELLLQQRSATKVTFPLVWTNTCCSHPLHRESEMVTEDHLGVRTAAQRKLNDELGITAGDAPVDGFTCLGRILYKAPSNDKWGEHEVDYLLFARRDVRLQPNSEEVADIKYVNREQLKELVRKADAGEDGVKLSPWFRLVVDKFLFDWWNRVENGTLSEAVDMEVIHKM